jgi:hypothetical protein
VFAVDIGQKKTWWRSNKQKWANQKETLLSAIDLWILFGGDILWKTLHHRHIYTVLQFGKIL